jgi:hypothetical protein
MKTLFFRLTAVLGMALFCMMPMANASPCSTGVSEVQGSWWSPSNTNTYTMCGCQAVKGQSASGFCGSGGGGGNQE